MSATDDDTMRDMCMSSQLIPNIPADGVLKDWGNMGELVTGITTKNDDGSQRLNEQGWCGQDTPPDIQNCRMDCTNINGCEYVIARFDENGKQSYQHLVNKNNYLIPDKGNTVWSKSGILPVTQCQDYLNNHPESSWGDMYYKYSCDGHMDNPYCQSYCSSMKSSWCSTSPNPSPPSPPAPEKSSSKTWIIILVLVLIAAAVWYYYKMHKPAPAAFFF